MIHDPYDPSVHDFDEAAMLKWYEKMSNWLELALLWRRRI